MTQTTIGYDEARKAQTEGRAVAHALWILISNEGDRNGYALRPQPWEGPGEYQHVEIDGQYGRLIRVPAGAKALVTDWPKKEAPATDKPIPKSLHTVTVLVQVARANMPAEGGNRPLRALSAAMSMLGLGGREDPYDLAGAALKQLSA